MISPTGWGMHYSGPGWKGLSAFFALVNANSVNSGPDNQPKVMVGSGQQDKYGIEIYAGDKLNYFNEKLEVVWNDKHKRFDFRVLYTITGMHVQQPLATLDTSICEITGNIYEPKNFPQPA